MSVEVKEAPVLIFVAPSRALRASVVPTLRHDGC